MSRERILEALRSLASELAPSDQPLDLVVVGGAALVILYGARTATKDVDAFLSGVQSGVALRRAAHEVAQSMGLPDDWLNDGAKGYVHGFSPGAILLETPSLIVRTLAVQQLLAMKLCAWRDDVDIADARLLLSRLEGSREAVWALVSPHLVPGRELKAQYALDDLWEEMHGST